MAKKIKKHDPVGDNLELELQEYFPLEKLEQWLQECREAGAEVFDAQHWAGDTEFTAYKVELETDEEMKQRQEATEKRRLKRLEHNKTLRRKQYEELRKEFEN